MPRVVIISDTHAMHGRVAVPDGDILVHCGDFTGTGRIAEVAAAGLWFRWMKERFSHVVVVAGNHDFLFERNRALAVDLINNGQLHLREGRDGGITYLEDGEATLDGVRIYGSPVTPAFMGWAFNRERGEDIRRHWDLVPAGLDLLVTHGPPMGILDQRFPLHGSEHLGCEELMAAVERARPRYHAFGHIHGGHGRSEHADTTFLNASVLDESYAVRNAPTVVDL